MSRQERFAQSHLEVTSIQSEEFVRVLTKFSQLFQACAGPQGKNHLVRNNSGGHVTITGSCGRLLSAMMISRPELKLLVSSVQAHLDHHGDGGLLLMTLCSHLILSSPRINPSTLTSLYKTFLDIIISYLSDPDCPVSVQADFSDLSVLLQYVRSVLSSKTLLNLTTSDCDHLSRLVLKTFLDSIPSEPSNLSHSVSDRVFCLTLDDSPVSFSQLEPGLLLRYPDFHVVGGEKKLIIRKASIPLGSTNGVANIDMKCVRVCVFSCSMSGDMEEIMDCPFELSDEQNAAVEREVKEKLLRVCTVLEEEGVGLLLCQRVIHPSVKAELGSKGIFFVDRLGSQVMPYVQDLAGAQPLRTILVDRADIRSSLGWVSSVRHVILSQKSFLCLTRPEPAVSTLVLCAPWEERLEELRMCVRASLHGLSQLARTKTLLMGGGCWLVNSSFMLQQKVMSELPSLCERHHCPLSAVLTALSAFRSSLHAWPHSLVAHTQENLVVDPSSFHLWRVPKGRDTTHDPSPVVCCCGSKFVTKEKLPEFVWLSKTEQLSYGQTFHHTACDIKVADSEPVVLDSFAMCVDALRQAVTTADLLLSIGQFITDKN